MAPPGALADHLAHLHIDICGLQEVRHPGTGCTTVNKGYRFIWSGGTQHTHGVGALLSPDTAKLLRDKHGGYAAISDRLLVLRFRPQGSLPVTAVIAYAPTDLTPDAAKDAFYEALHNIISQTPPHEYLLVLGDFNAQISAATPAESPAVGPHTLPAPHSTTSPLAAYRHTPKVNDNGTRLLDLCSAHNLAITNSFFSHPPSQTYTWYSNTGRDCATIDHILVRRPHIGSVLDVNARCPRTHPLPTFSTTDHALLTAHIQFRFSRTWLEQHSHRPRPSPPPRYFTELLRDPAVQESYALAISAALDALPPIPLPSNPDHEMHRLHTAIHTAAAATLGPRPKEVTAPQTLSDNTLTIARQLQAARTLAAAPGESDTDWAYEAKRLLDQFKASSRGDVDKHWNDIATTIQSHLDNNRPQPAFQTLNRLTSRQQTTHATVIRVDGRLRFGAQAVAEAFGVHFNDLHNNPSTIDPNVLATHLSQVPYTPDAPPLPPAATPLSPAAPPFHPAAPPLPPAASPLSPAAPPFHPAAPPAEAAADSTSTPPALEASSALASAAPRILFSMRSSRAATFSRGPALSEATVASSSAIVVA